MKKTKFAGLTVVEENDSVYTDGGTFLARNPEVTDRMLEVGAVTHRHDEHAALTDPAVGADASVSDTGGSIPAGVTLYVSYTLEDAQGGETTMAPAVAVSTDEPMQAPDTGFSAVADYTAGTLLAGTYYYAITLLDGSGGQSEIGPAVAVTRAPGYPAGRAMFSGLTSDFAATGAVGWRLYRAVNGGDWAYLTDGSTDTFADDGIECADPTMRPPSASDTNATNQLTVNVPAAAMAGATRVNLYLSVDGAFQSPALFAGYDVPVSGDLSVAMPALAVTEGSPPDVSTSLPGANKIDPDTELLDWHWKRPVANAAALPSLGNEPGDVRVTSDTFAIYGWDGSSWHSIAGSGATPTVSRWKDPVAALGNLPASGNTAGDARLVLSDGSLHLWNGSAWELVFADSIGHVIAHTGVDFPQRSRLSFEGALSVTDDPAGDRTIVNATAAPGGLPERETHVFVSNALASGATQQATIELERPGALLAVTTNRPARVRIYATQAQADDDVARPVSVDPPPGVNHGVLLDLVTTDAALVYDLAPVVMLASMEQPPTGVLPITVTNIDDDAGTVTTTLTVTPIGGPVGPAGNEAFDGWHSLPLDGESPWAGDADLPTPASPRYGMLGGFVQLDGVIAPGGARDNELVGHLPFGFWPESDKLFAVPGMIGVSTPAMVSLIVRTTGELIVTSAAGLRVHLDGVAFRAAT
jgi:hypothetical protein